MHDLPGSKAVLFAANFTILPCSSNSGPRMDTNPSPSQDGSPSSLDGATDEPLAGLDGGQTDGAEVGLPTGLDGGPAAGVDGGSPVGSDGGLGCCPTSFLLYECREPDGGTGYACHDPDMGCASSLMCGAGCDPQGAGGCLNLATERHAAEGGRPRQPPSVRRRAGGRVRGCPHDTTVAGRSSKRDRE
jgi:hypothetical protein